jgi:hypothetical protein
VRIKPAKAGSLCKSSEGEKMSYQNFRIFVDSPADQPSLGFKELADALAQIAYQSDPRFAIGVFGDWGSGKTTLMRAIQKRLDARSEVVTVWFNAWRFEREPHIIVPLIDHLRARLNAIASESSDKDTITITRKAAAALGRAGAALLQGLTITAKVPGLDAKVDFKKVMDNLGNDNQVAKRVLSFYSASFEAIRNALEEYYAHGARRIVVFVDDLDRCLPENALQVLESMKLLFDLEGFVFIVGLNQSVIQRAVSVKYASTFSDETDHEDGARGKDYIKKIFQVPFGLPQVSIEQLPEYFKALLSSNELHDDQRKHLQKHVEPHLQYLSQDGAINPREIKRILNAYIMQLKMLEPRLRKDLLPNVVMTLQVISFRPDWLRIYDKLATDAELVQETLNNAIASGLSHMAIYGSTIPIPYDLSNYLKQPFANELLTTTLKTYLSTAEATRSTDTSLVAFQAELGTLRAQLDSVAAGEASDQVVSDVASRLDILSSKLSSGILKDHEGVDIQIFHQAVKGLPNSDESKRTSIVNGVIAALDQIEDILFELRRRTVVVAAS